MAKATTRGRKRVTFRANAEPGSQVYVTGCFNDWDPSRKQLKDKNGDGTFIGAMLLPPGEYEYKFVVNGNWCVDPEQPEWHANDMGSLNSVLHVG